MFEALRQFEFRAMAVLLRIGESEGASIKEARLAATAVLKSCAQIAARDFPIAAKSPARTEAPAIVAPPLMEGAGGRAIARLQTQRRPAPQATQHSTSAAPTAATLAVPAVSSAPTPVTPSTSSAPTAASTMLRSATLAPVRPTIAKAPASSLPSDFSFLSSLLAPIAPVNLSPSSTSAALLSAAGVPTALAQSRPKPSNPARAA